MPSMASKCPIKRRFDRTNSMRPTTPSSSPAPLRTQIHSPVLSVHRGKSIRYVVIAFNGCSTNLMF